MRQVCRRAGFIFLLAAMAAVSGCGGGGGDSKSDNTAAPAKPANVVSTAGFQDVTLNWDVVPDATSYNVYWSTSPGVTKTTGTKISDVTGTTLYETGLSNGVIYYYTVTAVNAKGESNESEPASAIPGAPMPPPPPPLPM